LLHLRAAVHHHKQLRAVEHHLSTHDLRAGKGNSSNIAHGRARDQVRHLFGQGVLEVLHLKFDYHIFQRFHGDNRRGWLDRRSMQRTDQT